MAVTRIGYTSFTSADSDRLAAFYRNAFGFRMLETAHLGGSAFSRLLGLDGAGARSVRLGLGEQKLELLTFTKAGVPYPADCSSDDLRFQHVAIVVSDIEHAYAQLLEQTSWTPITRGPPQVLPQGSGGVTAFKFKDPEGHPLELLAFPPGEIPLYWQQAIRKGGPCLGIDHSAIVVANTVRSVQFYEHLLGLRLGGRSLNCGKEQERLDSIRNAVVEVSALVPSSSSTPHLELLCYLSTVRLQFGARLASNDIASTRLAIEVDDYMALEQKLGAMPISFVSTGRVTLDDGRLAALIRDPDGHALLLLGST